MTGMSRRLRSYSKPALINGVTKCFGTFVVTVVVTLARVFVAAMHPLSCKLGPVTGEV
jgi:hypothetical protein